MTQPFVVVLRALRPAVTDVTEMNTHAGVSAAIKAWAFDVVAVLFVLSAYTIVESMATCVDRQAVAWRAEAAIVCVRAGLCFGVWVDLISPSPVQFH
jgi:hypothetical protein